MNITLQPQVAKLVDERVRSGDFASAEQAVNDLLAFALGDEQLSPENLEELRAEIDIGIAEADRGEFVEFTAQDIIAEGRASLASRQRGE